MGLLQRIIRGIIDTGEVVKNRVGQAIEERFSEEGDGFDIETREKEDEFSRIAESLKEDIGLMKKLSRKTGYYDLEMFVDDFFGLVGLMNMHEEDRNRPNKEDMLDFFSKVSDEYISMEKKQKILKSYEEGEVDIIWKMQLTSSVFYRMGYIQEGGLDGKGCVAKGKDFAFRSAIDIMIGGFRRHEFEAYYPLFGLLRCKEAMLKYHQRKEDSDTLFLDVILKEHNKFEDTNNGIILDRLRNTLLGELCGSYEEPDFQQTANLTVIPPEKSPDKTIDEKKYSDIAPFDSALSKLYGEDKDGFMKAIGECYREYRSRPITGTERRKFKGGFEIYMQKTGAGKEEAYDKIAEKMKKEFRLDDIV